jgi:hypothetical protein
MAGAALLPRPVGVLVDMQDACRHEREVAGVLAAGGEHLLEQAVPLGEVLGRPQWTRSPSATRTARSMGAAPTAGPAGATVFR